MSTIRTTPVVRWLLIANVAAFLFQMIADTFFGTHLMDLLGLVPYRVIHHKALWQFVSYMFLHGDLFHILFNMLVLWMIGSELEAHWGPRFFTRYYFTCGTAGAFLYMLVQLFVVGGTESTVPVVGSSGAIYGLLVAYGILYSERVMLFMMVFPMKARHFVLLLAGIELVTTVFNTRSGVANLAHLGGMVAGFATLSLSAYLRIRARRNPGSGGGRKLKRKPKHLRLVINNDAIQEFETDDTDDTDGSGKPSFH